VREKERARERAEGKRERLADYDFGSLDSVTTFV
jgi:hypothetical protein